MPPGLERTFTNLSDWQIAAIVGALILVGLVIMVLVVFLSTIGRIGLIQGTLRAEQGETALSFGDLFDASLPYFWRVFGLNLLVGLALGLLIFLGVIVGIFFSVITFGIALLCLIPLICVLVPLAWLVQVVLEQANVALVVEDLNIPDALQRGWEVFREHLGTMIVMGLILILGAGVVTLVISAPLAAVVVPAITAVALGGEQAIRGGVLIAALCFVAYLPVLLVLAGIVRAYVGAAWSLTYLRLTGQNGAEALEPATAAT